MTDENTPPTCETDDCHKDSAFLLAEHGDRCHECAAELQPQTVAYLEWAFTDTEVEG